MVAPRHLPRDIAGTASFRPQSDCGARLRIVGALLAHRAGGRVRDRILPTSPSLSVVMPVKNALPYLDEAIESILAQTWRDFEFVILDDGSDDGSSESLRRWAARDGRIRLLRAERSLGPVGSSNAVVAAARAPIVARMDADDVADPDRLRRELAILGRNPDAVLIGSIWQGIDEQGRMVREPDLSAIGKAGFAAPFAHGSIMFRKNVFERAGGYRDESAFWEDLDLYLRMMRFGRLLVIPAPLYRHRFSGASTRLTSPARHVEEAVDLMFRCRAACERGEDYAPLLERHKLAGGGGRKLHPFTFVSLGAIILWAGARPGTLQGLVQRAKLRPDRATLVALAWALWAELSPRSLRKFKQALLARKNRRLAARFSGVDACDWRPAPRRGLSDPKRRPAAAGASPWRRRPAPSATRG
ncbi:MAG: hypothetical protein QOH81_1061 [Sphingomonadales bacterium]|nr:hypothetical protein [Sphingomonadales bacterium]